MKIAVCLKQVPDPASVLAIDAADGRVVQVEPEPVYTLNPADRSALELALELVRLHGGRVTPVTLGPAGAEAVLRWALARGADEAIHLVCRDEPDAPATAALLAGALRELGPDLVLLGDRSQDRGDGQVWAWLAEALGLPVISAGVRVWKEGNTLLAERNLGRGRRQAVACPLPAVVAVEAGASEPRYISVHAQHRVPEGKVRRVDWSPQGVSPAASRAVRVVGVGPRRIRPKRIAAPDPSLSAVDRLQLALQGGISERKGRVVAGEVSEMVDQVVRFLQEEGILASP